MAKSGRPHGGVVAFIRRDRRIWGAVGLGAGFAIGLLASGKPWHRSAAWGDIPTWITAIATIGLLIGAIITADYAIKAFRKQAKEVEILTEQNDRDIADRHQAQAARVYTVVEDPGPHYAHPYAKNGSDFPVYDAKLWQTDPGGLWEDPADIGMIPPGARGIDNRQIHYQDALANTLLTFRDAAGAHWIRMPDGTLRMQERDNARDSVLAALGRPIPAAEPTTATDAAGQVGEPPAPGAQ